MATFDKDLPANAADLLSAAVRQNFQALPAALFGVPLLADPTFLIWPAGDAAAPAHWSLSGAGAAIARTGTGLGDTSRKAGKYAAKITAGGGALATLEQRILSVNAYDDVFDALEFSGGMWVKSSSANAARIGIYDGAGTTYSSYHTGGGAFEWLSCVRTIDGAATQVAYRLEVAAGTNAHASGAGAVLGAVKPIVFMPTPGIVGAYVLSAPGNLAIGTDKDLFEPARPGLVTWVQLHAKTAPVGATLNVDVNTYDGAAMTSLFAAGPAYATILTTASRGGKAPDGTYARRCLNGITAAPTPAAGTRIGFDIDQVGSTTPGADLKVRISVLQFVRPLEMFIPADEWN